MNAVELALLARVRKARDVWRGVEQLAPQLDDQLFVEVVGVAGEVLDGVIERLATVLSERGR